MKVELASTPSVITRQRWLMQLRRSLRMTKVLYVCIFASMAMTEVACADSTSPYAGQDSREIKALAADDVEAYLSGKGMGLAKAAELNGYPGPAHVIAMAGELQLSSSQKERTEALFNSMEAKAIALGRSLVAQERKLDEQFAAKKITRESLAVLLARIGELQAKVRGAHLEAHLAQLAILTPSQAAKYQELRGYTASDTHQDGHQHLH
jgi:Spy/CpxP family protein refolding chaperone